ncbi:MAG: hypothetical protein K0R78_3211 [Pelosinus sp.]|jgi:hypothetical protein|nr:hypothetical protein [Pelosinus sp.]
MVGFLVNQMKFGKVTYKEVIEARPDLQIKIDAYINENSLTIDKNV